MLPNRETLLCRYHYDPLDRLVDCTPTVQATTRRFYQKDRLTTEIQGTLQRSIMQHDDQVLAQQCGGLTQLLATDQQRSVLNVLDAARLNPLAYSPYGHRPAENGLLSLLGFNGERPDPVTGWYLLGNGYRAFNPVLMRFNSTDSWSPFGEGGLNAYGYCVGDPVNRGDRSGHSSSFFIWMASLFRRATSKGFNRLAGSTGTSISSTLSTNSLSATRTVIPDAPVGKLIPGLEVPSSNSYRMPDSTIDANKIWEDTSRVFSVKKTLEDADLAIKNAKTKQYTGSKLKKLKHSTKKLQKYNDDMERVVLKHQTRLENLREYGLINLNDSLTPRQLAENTITQQRKIVKDQTKILNIKLRDSE